MDFSEIKSVTIPEGEVKQIAIGDTVIWNDGYTNLVPLSTEADDTTIYNGGLGYKNGYRLRSGGAEGASTNASHTGYIPIKPNDIVYLSGYNAMYANAENAINVYDESHTNIGQITKNVPAAGYGIFESIYAAYCWDSIVENPTGVYKWVVPPHEGIAYIRVTGMTRANGSSMVVTVNEEITE